MNWKFSWYALCLAMCALCLIGCQKTDNQKANVAATIPTTVSQQPEYGYSWEEFENMTAEEQIAFQNSFPDLEAFDAWLQSVQNVPSDMPWDNGGKQPELYTWEEFEALTAEQQIAFQNSFESQDVFTQWMDQAQYEELVLPWDNGGKVPESYTWEEFEALPGDLQIAFQDSFESFEAFDNWMQRVNPEESRFSWDDEGKPIVEYTWEEFENMTPDEQMAFQNAFDSFEAFDHWLINAQYTEPELPWENGGKQPDEYTWEEFEALSAELQMIFQNSFESIEDFDAWLQRVNP